MDVSNGFLDVTTFACMGFSDVIWFFSEFFFCQLQSQNKRLVKIGIETVNDGPSKKRTTNYKPQISGEISKKKKIDTSKVLS